MIRPQIVLCVPGPWSSRTDLVTSLSPHGALLAGTLLQFDQQSFECEPRMQRDPRMEGSFRAASSYGEAALSDDDFAAVSRHRSVLYVLSGQYGPDDAAEKAHRMMRLGGALLDAGGIAVKCESSGKAHSAKRWRALTELANEGLTRLGGDDKDAARWRFWMALRQAYVYAPISTEAGDLYSCGMHLLGRPDAITQRGDDDSAAHQLLTEFSQYVLAENTPNDGEHFRLAKDAPRWRLSTEPCRGYPEDDFFFNPYGYFRLQPAGDAPAGES